MIPLAELPESAEQSLWASDVLKSLQRASEARGLTFYRDPPREVVPDFLGNYRPDAIALGPEGGIIFEVKRRRSPGSEPYLAEISKRVAGQKGWEFRVIYLNPPTERPPEIARPTWPQVEAAFAETEALAEGGHAAAALISGWAVLEAMARFARDTGDGRPSRALSPLQAVQTLAEEGLLDDAAAERLRGLATLRNAVAHGDLSAAVPPDRVAAFLADLRAIAAAIEAAA